MTVTFAIWTGTETALVITACGTLLTAVVSAVGVVVSLRNRAKLEEVKKQTDGLTEKLVAAKEVIAKDAGKKEERSEVAERVIVAQAAEDKKESQKIQLPPQQNAP